MGDEDDFTRRFLNRVIAGALVLAAVLGAFAIGRATGESYGRQVAAAECKKGGR
jgi:hypothetical protein